MRLCYVVQRYGENLGGGAEEHTRAFAERLAARGHDVHVATTCAESYVDWADVFPPGDTELNGVHVHRFSVPTPRDEDFFGPLHLRLINRRRPVLVDVQREWLRLQGPEAPALVDWLRVHARGFDVVLFFTYLYWPTWAGLREIAGVVPTVLHPTAHDEPMIEFSIFDEVFTLPDALALSTVEERALVGDRFRNAPEHAIIGIGIDLPEASNAPAPERPYVCYVGRVDRAKGVDDMVDLFAQYKAAHPGELDLVLAGDVTFAVPPHPDVRVLGLVDNQTRDDLMRGAVALVQPSRYESFSMVLLEAMAAGTPAIVNGASDVMAGHAERSGAAFTYSDAATFATAVERLRNDQTLRSEMGLAGRTYAATEYAWDVVLDRYEELLAHSAVLHQRTRT